MIWRRVTAVLVCACLAVPVLMYLRDVGAGPPTPTSSEARFDAQRLLASISPQGGTQCGVEMLGVRAPHTWRVKLRTPTWQGCYDLDPAAFRFTTAHGFGGVNWARCEL
ncbi:MAG: hypothetical protein ACXVV5_22695 [Solirubrobacteraceae bacterium]